MFTIMELSPLLAATLCCGWSAQYTRQLRGLPMNYQTGTQFGQRGTAGLAGEHPRNFSVFQVDAHLFTLKTSFRTRTVHTMYLRQRENSGNRFGRDKSHAARSVLYTPSLRTIGYESVPEK
jgi:hypothetical protein